MRLDNKMEFWIAAPTRAAEVGKQAEANGWDGLATVHSQNLSGDPYVFLALAAGASEKLGLRTSVTTSVTRHVAVTATSALSVQKYSDGCMILDTGRGDSALVHLGRAPAKLAWFENDLLNLQAYLRGDEVPFDQNGILDDVAPPADHLGLADALAASAIRWVTGMPEVPVEVAATGAKVVGIAARHVGRIMFALVADAGRDPASLKFGAYVNVVCHADRSIGRELSRAGISLFARFSVVHGTVSGPADDRQTQVFQDIHSRYEMNKHVQAGGQQSTALTDEFMDYDTIVGGVEHRTIANGRSDGARYR
jgi:5,10-methylenetetrahydromethanopterin reductase